MLNSRLGFTNGSNRHIINSNTFKFRPLKTSLETRGIMRKIKTKIMNFVSYNWNKPFETHLRFSISYFWWYKSHLQCYESKQSSTIYARARKAWIHAEYAYGTRATNTRTIRESGKREINRQKQWKSNVSLLRRHSLCGLIWILRRTSYYNDQCDVHPKQWRHSHSQLLQVAFVGRWKSPF